MLDTFQRYKVAYQEVEKISKNIKQVKLLDVGSNGIGFAEYNRFKNVEQTNLDIQEFDEKLKKDSPHIKFVTYDGRVFPFLDNEFDILLCSDTLEHVPAKYRGDFIKECLRVSKNTVIFTFPVSSSSFFEKLLYYATFKKSVFLKEHIEYGLPKIKNFNDIIKNNGYSIVGKYENINRFLWIPVKLLSSIFVRLWRDKSKEFIYKKFKKYIKKERKLLNIGIGYSDTFILEKKQL